MSQVYQFIKGKIALVSGIGIPNYTKRETGKFQVRDRSGAKDFPSLIAATLFYLTLDCRASIWDMTEEPELVEAKFMLS
jgi:hypothetical protein